jgi:hypothetical protein
MANPVKIWMSERFVSNTFAIRRGFGGANDLARGTDAMHFSSLTLFAAGFDKIVGSEWCGQLYQMLHAV